MDTIVFDFLILVRAIILTAILGWLGLSFDEKSQSEVNESDTNAAVHNVLPFGK